MSNWKLHTPNGVNDILPDECAVKKEIESTIWSVFSSIGYKEVETPIFEYYDCYLGLSGQISQEHMFKFLTSKDVFCIKTGLYNINRPYGGNKGCKFRQASALPTQATYTELEQTQGARQREFTQRGIELIGSYSPAADAEAFPAACGGCSAVGNEEFSMEIG